MRATTEAVGLSQALSAPTATTRRRAGGANHHQIDDDSMETPKLSMGNDNRALAELHTPHKWTTDLMRRWPQAREPQVSGLVT